MHQSAPAFLLVVLAWMLAGPGAAPAQEAAPMSRYSVTPSNGGFVRLDTETGSVSHCVRRDGTWRCEPASENRQTEAQPADSTGAADRLAARLDRLERSVGRLSEQVEALGSAPVSASRLDRLEQSVAALAAEVGALKAALAPAEDAPRPSVDAAPVTDDDEPGLARRLVKPLISLVGNLKREAATDPAGE